MFISAQFITVLVTLFAVELCTFLKREKGKLIFGIWTKHWKLVSPGGKFMFNVVTPFVGSVHTSLKPKYLSPTINFFQFPSQKEVSIL